MEPCPAIAAACHCVLTEPHEIHECEDFCGGRWTGSDRTGDMKVVRFPHVLFSDGSDAFDVDFG
jgi:hypothetical protein